MKYLPYALIVLLSTALVLAVVTRPGDGPSLAEKAQAACGPNAQVIDFTSGAELGGVPVKDLILVTCESRKSNQYGQFKTFKEVVDR